VLLGFILPAIVISYDARSAASLSDAVLDSSDEFIVLDSGASKCKAQIKQAKDNCDKKATYYRQVRESKCGDPELGSILERIQNGQARTKSLQAELRRAEAALQKAKGDEGIAVADAHSARSKLLKQLVVQIKEEKTLTKDKTKQHEKSEREKQLQAEAHRATLAAVHLAETSPSMQKVQAQATKAKDLWEKMVEEQVAMGRAKFSKTSVKKTEKNVQGNINSLLESAKVARVEEDTALKQVKDATDKVAKANLKLSRTEVETATLQERVGIVEKSGAQSRDASERITTQSADEKLKAAQAVVKKDEATYNAAKSWRATLPNYH